jgi:hypothetical protein
MRLVLHSTCEQRHKVEMFDQMLQYRYIEYRMSLYIRGNLNESCISTNISDVFKMSTRTLRQTVECRMSCGKERV